MSYRCVDFDGERVTARPLAVGPFGWAVAISCVLKSHDKRFAFDLRQRRRHGSERRIGMATPGFRRPWRIELRKFAAQSRRIARRRPRRVRSVTLNTWTDFTNACAPL